ncbi:hypothetical protein CP533_6802 [Ophiocordyceps camponoti-saundersi (nom. inval.)]|nr:hypothetical protein CP533_6802 [Ophiocordyceps camponoti-saundersi (nom. inval.)]
MTRLSGTIKTVRDEGKCHEKRVSRRNSSIGASSVDEIILFRGRNRKVEHTRHDVTKPQPSRPCPVAQASVKGSTSPGVHEVQLTRPTTYSRPGGNPPKRRRRGTRKSEDSLLNDYIANMCDNYEALHIAERPTPTSIISHTSHGDESGLSPRQVAMLSFGNDEGGRTERRCPSTPQSAEQIINDDESSKRAQRPFQNHRNALEISSPQDRASSDLQEQIWNSFESNRTKKRQRKMQREERRRVGLLGIKPKPNDLRMKYPSGISILEITQEIGTFLQGTQETILFPPMNRRARKIVHELANKFNVKSKSVGKAEQRRPTLVRTLKTANYVGYKFNQAVARMDLRHPSCATARAIYQNTDTRMDAAASYQDGEIVGARAPVLGVGNRGRIMLEKMGWSSGTPLGATQKGILLPLTHAVRRSRCGLT